MNLLRRHATAVSVVVLALLAYVPSLTAAPGRMPADSKLYVYLNPGRFLGDTTTTFDPRQFAGWVPHQHIAYLWPTGPWYWLFDALSVPDWIAHRLWIGTLLFTAGLGVRWMARTLGSAPLAALVAALVYQLSPYILPYISRTSVLLLPYAGLGWIVGLTVLASLRGRWRYPAAIALVVLTVGAVNATALAMVIPAPTLWLVNAAWGRTITWRRAAATAAKTAVLCIGVSLWWIAMLVIQGRHGADVLAYSESLDAVSFTSTSTEVARGLGYWLFYVRDAYAATTTASLPHLVSGRTIVAGYVVLAAGLAGLTVVRWTHRRFAALLFGAGLILGVGVHPIDDPSPLMSLLVGDGEGGLALALRSSTRAVPVMLLGVGLGAGALVTRIGDLRRPRPDRLTPAAVRLATAVVIGLAAVVALPALRNGGFVDPALERDESPPQAWIDAAADLDARPPGARVLQVPGSEFGAFRWGYTVDQPLPALTTRPLVTRDLLPLGSPAAMDLVFALDDRFQTGTVEPGAVATVSRLLGIDTIWITGDVSYDRFRLARPEVVTDELTSSAAVGAGLGSATSYGDATVMSPTIPMIDNRSLSDPRIGRPIAPVTLVDVDDPIPTMRVKNDVVVVAGSGDGLVDAAAAGLIDGSEAILYDASIDRTTHLDDGFRYVITDSNRDRAHQWRSSQDVTGFTESADDGSDVLRFESGDQRLPVFGFPSADTQSADTQTVSVQDGPVTARASSYGERFAYLPEDRAVMAIDGDPDTAWIVADRAPAIGESIELGVTPDAGPVDHVDLLQPPAGPDQRTITEIEIATPDGPAQRVALDDTSRTGSGQRAALDPTQGPITITITSTTTPQPPIGEAIGGVGFSEIDLGLGPTTEFIRTPIDRLDLAADATAVDVVLTRLRTDPADRWRSDPEPTLSRRIEPTSEATAEPVVTLRLDRRLDDAALADLLGEPVVASSHLTGAPSTRGAAAFDGDAATAWTTEFDTGVGESVTFRGGENGSAARVEIAQPGGDHSPITGLRITDGVGSFDVAVPADAEATIDLPRPVDLSDVSFEITSIEAHTTRNRRFDEPTQLPAAVSEIRFDGASPEVVPIRRLTAECSTDFVSIDGTPVALSFDIATVDALAGNPIDATACGVQGGTVSLDVGTHDVVSVAGSRTGFDVDRVVLTSGVDPGAGAVSPVPVIEPEVVDASSRHRTLIVPPCPDGCWVIHGEGFNDAWTASADGVDLGEPTLVDGNANGWWLAPTTADSRIEIDWPVQRRLDIAFLLSAIAALICLVLVVADRRRADDLTTGLTRHETDLTTGLTRHEIDGSHSTRRMLVVPAIVTVVAAALLVQPVWAIPAALVWAVAAAIDRPWGARAVGAVGAAIVVGTGLIVTYDVLADRPFPDAGWPVRFEWLHGWTLLGVVLIVGATLVTPARERDE